VSISGVWKRVRLIGTVRSIGVGLWGGSDERHLRMYRQLLSKQGLLLEVSVSEGWGDAELH